MDRVILKVKQGEELNISFTVKQGNDPFNLDGYNIIVEAKYSPTVKSKTLFRKVITTTTDSTNEGVILYPNLGEFVIHLNKEDTSFPIGEYSLVIAVQNNFEENIISSSNCSSAVYEICPQ